MKRYYILLLLLGVFLSLYSQRNITEEEWDDMRLDKPVVIEFYANWCGPSHQQSSIISRLVKEFPEISFYKVDIERENEWFSYETETGALPMIQFIFQNDRRNGGVSKSTINGFMPYYEIRDSCQSILRRYNDIQRNNKIPLKMSLNVSDTIIDIEGEKYHLALSGAVDMGTDVLWSAYNIGSNSPEKFGDYYAWGESIPKNSYSWDNYKYCYVSNEVPYIIKYDPYEDKRDRLQIADDIVKQTYGGNWRMPLRKEISDLIREAKWNIFDLRGVHGCVAFSTVTKNAIFIPFAGCMTIKGLVEKGETANMWSLDMVFGEPLNAYSLVLDNQISVQQWNKYMGFSIRPIYDPKYDY